MSIAVVIPCFRVKAQISDVLGSIGPEVTKIIVVDDCCPEGTGKFVSETISDSRVHVVFHKVNKGVGGAVLSGYEAALEAGEVDVVVKLDGDGQMDPSLISDLVRPILECRADYVKGNRFFSLENLIQMPGLRLFGNSGLSFVIKLVSGYWSVMDPTNGFTAISLPCLKVLPMDKIDHTYFFESDMLFRLGTLRAMVMELPMDAKYGSEESSLNIGRVLLTFPAKYFVRFMTRIFYNYYLRDFSIGSLMLISAIMFTAGGIGFGAWRWSLSVETPATSGTVMLAALPIILGFYSIMSFFSFDVLSEPRYPSYPVRRKN